jgi:hypothetical protein
LRAPLPLAALLLSLLLPPLLRLRFAELLLRVVSSLPLAAKATQSTNTMAAVATSSAAISTATHRKPPCANTREQGQGAQVA